MLFQILTLLSTIVFAVDPPNPCSGAQGTCEPCKKWLDAAHLQCIECHTGYYLAFLSDDRVFCAKKPND